MDKFTEVEPLTDEFSIGHTRGALCYLIDDDGRIRSEGYHEIWKDWTKAGGGHWTYYGKRGASEGRISTISEYLLD